MLASLQRLVRRLWAGANAYPASLPGGFPFAGPLTRFANAVNRLRAIALMVILLAGPVLVPAIIIEAYEGLTRAQALVKRGVSGRATVLDVSKIPGGRAQHSSETYLIKYAYAVPGPDGREVRYTNTYRQSVSRGSTVKPPQKFSIIYDPEDPRMSALNQRAAQNEIMRARFGIFVLPGFWLLLFAGVYFGGRERKTFTPAA